MSFKNKLIRIFTILTEKSPKKVPVIINTTSDQILSGRCAIITGGTSGIGYAIAKKFLLCGATVIITGRNNDKLVKAVEILKEEYDGRIFGYILDNTRIDIFHDAIQEMEKLASSKIDILVNNAGVHGKTSFLNISEEDFDNVLRNNLKSVVFFSQEFANYMIENHIEGNILNIGSSSGIRPANSPYMIAKWGVRGLTLGTAKTLIKHNIVVNGIAPGPTATPMLGKTEEELSGTLNDARRYVHPEEISSLAANLVSNSCRMIVGEMVNIGGGAGTLTFDDMSY